MEIGMGGRNQTTWRPKTVLTPKGPMTRRQIAEAFNIPFGTVCRRLWQKYPPDKLFLPPIKTHGYPYARTGNPFRIWKTAWGTETSGEIAKRIGLDYQKFKQRVRVSGWTLEDAANTPSRGIRGKHFIIPPDEYRRRYRELHGHAAAMAYPWEKTE